jgi:hypothetical protein
MRLSPLSQVRSAITGKNRFPVTIRQIHAQELIFGRSHRIFSRSFGIHGTWAANFVLWFASAMRT